MDDTGFDWEAHTYSYISSGGVRNMVRENTCSRCGYKVTETWVLNHIPDTYPPQGTWSYYVLGDTNHDHPDPEPVGARMAA
jgi:hypothetical protein